MDNELHALTKKKVAVLYHRDADGFGAAYACWKALNDSCELLFGSVQYGEEPPYDGLKAFGPELIYIVDFSYTSEILLRLENEFGSVRVIDHHKTAEKELSIFDSYKLGPDSGVFFCADRAGCTLTWDLFFFGEVHPPDILLYVEDRDLWKFNMEHSKEINAYIATLDEDFEIWDNFYTPEAYTCGVAVLKFQAEQIKRRLRDVVMVRFDQKMNVFMPEFGGGALRIVPFLNCSDNISEVGNALCAAYPDSPFSVTYCDRKDGTRSYSLRSNNGFDVSVVAKAFSGGGHPGASGFSLPSPSIILRLENEFGSVRLIAAR